FADAPDADFAIPAFEREVLGHAVAAVDLHGAVHNAAAGFAGDQLGHRGFGAVGLAAVGLVGGSEGEPAARADVALVVDDHPLDGPAAGEAVAEGLALVGVGDGHLLGLHGDTDAAGGVGDALAAEAVVGDAEALVPLAEDIP